MGENPNGLLPWPHGLPRPLDVELPRPRLVDRLRSRWTRPVTLMIAGPGFGKTTALAQAVRANLLDPRGIDVWVTCEPGHEDPTKLARAITEALGVSYSQAGPRDVLDALIRHAPLDVCLVLDDVHEVPRASPGALLLGEVVRALPDTAHLVLSGRHTPDIPLARLQAAGEVAALGTTDLAFTGAETAALACRLGGELTDDLHGWPALIRLSLTAGPDAPWRYAREEVLSRIPARMRLALAALTTLGTATADEIAAVVGARVPVERLAKWVPLVDRVGERYRAHDLWTDPVARAVSADSMAVLRKRSVEVLSARGDLAGAGRVAIRARDWATLARLAVELVRTTLSVLPCATADRWLAAVPPRWVDDPAFLLLRAAAVHARDFTDPSIDKLIDDACQGMLDADDSDAAAVAHRAEQLDAPMSPVLKLLRHSVAAVLAELAGEPEAALEQLARAPTSEVPRALALSTMRFHVHCLAMCGRGRDAAELAERMLSDDLAQRHAAVARWFDGDPGDLVTSWREESTDTTARGEFVARALRTVVSASWGEDSPKFPCGDPEEKDNARDAVLACAAHAAIAVVRGEEDAARETYAQQLKRWPADNRFAERHLRRFLALGYVLSEELRTRWDATELGPSHQAARAAGRAVVRARAGDLHDAKRLPNAHALCFLPLPWSVELAARLANTGTTKLGGWLADTVGTVVHHRFRDLARSREDPELAAGATRLLAALPTPPDHPLSIEVIGPMRVVRNGVAIQAPELRRARVRQLLGLLVLRPVLGREQVMDLLWPGLDPASAARNLRVTMTHLRRLLEPERSGGEASYCLRCEGDTIRLVRGGALSTDLWLLHELSADGAGDVDLLGRAVALWRGDPLPDLAELCEAEIAQLRARHVHNLLALGELRLVAADPEQAWRLADRALTLEPFEPRGHRLALAAALRTRNPQRTAQARARVLDSLRQLGVRPDRATEILLRQASAGAATGS